MVSGDDVLGMMICGKGPLKRLIFMSEIKSKSSGTASLNDRHILLSPVSDKPSSQGERAEYPPKLLIFGNQPATN